MKKLVQIEVEAICENCKYCEFDCDPNYEEQYQCAMQGGKVVNASDEPCDKWDLDLVFYHGTTNV